jgi:hypothetical protein
MPRATFTRLAEPHAWFDAFETSDERTLGPTSSGLAGEH